ncbi:radical SAM family heme chaperone HemW [Jingyaoa shaoxingensis]|uniref:Heme chaperone HemW n=1 Tax=Jingyaoa shaoxingensis TaxID=2763671 RepID=A0ABR7N7R4_9FIRM|nr:radical SAM family heme chaperone HemW [Jingyaoa shaoxingensis]MBC8572447.1 oxygen-independent coproporphyrinogen III oxidase [Jingyaoa shaoxingensis]
MEKELELYIHIPFCVRKCNYCDFLSFAADETVQRQYTDALCREISDWEGYGDGRVSTVFIGGGTPSILPVREMERILDTVYRHARMENETEITMECNPGTADREKLLAWKNSGINRISFGLQSTDNRELKRLGRIHTWEDFQESWHLARKAGFENMNVDLMSALPGQSTQSWQKTLDRVLELEPEHISAYSLIIEEGTPFYGQFAEADQKRAADEPQNLLPSEEEERQMYEDTLTMLAAHGYHRYEISNYARPGRECRHNCGYWTGVPYKGFGLGAASFLHHERYKNTESMQEYLTGEDPVREWQKLNKAEEMEEMMILGLRMMQGVSTREFQKKYNVSMKEIYGDVISKYGEMGLLKEEKGRISLTEAGISVSNVILSDFLLAE